MFAVREAVQKVMKMTFGAAFFRCGGSFYLARFQLRKGFTMSILHLENEQIEFYGRLKNYEDLHKELYRCHKSFIVNKNKIKNIDSKERIIFLDNGEVCYASAPLIKGLMK